MSGVEIPIIISLAGGIVGVISSTIGHLLQKRAMKKRLSKNKEEIQKDIEYLGNQFEQYSKLSAGLSNANSVNNEPTNMDIVNTPSEQNQETYRSVYPLFNAKTQQIEFAYTPRKK